MKRHILQIVVMITVCICVNGCSVFMAGRQPDKKDLNLFAQGTPRDLLIAEFGLPTAIVDEDGKKYDVFQFTQGYSKGAKTGRAVLHGTADVFTLGLWEIVGIGSYPDSTRKFVLRIEANHKYKHSDGAELVCCEKTLQRLTTRS